MVVYIYILRDPRTNEIKYVGKTVDPRSRSKKHGLPSQLRGSGVRKVKWILELRSIGLRPIFEIIEECTEENWEERERYWISYHGGPGVLVNVREGGEFSPLGYTYKHSDETKKLLRQKTKEQFSDPTRRSTHKQAMKKWSDNLTEEGREKLREGQAKAIATGAQSKYMKSFWKRMTQEQREQFIRERRAKQDATPKKLSDEELFEILSNAHKKVWQNETQRKNRIDGIKAAWSDPARKAARLEKLAKSMAQANEKRSASLKATWEKRRQAQS